VSPSDAHQHPTLLTDEDAAILMALWRDAHEPVQSSIGRDRGLTRDQLVELLVDTKAKPGEPRAKPFLKKTTLFSHLTKIGLPLFSRIVRIEEERPSPGPNRKSKAGKNCYRFSLKSGEVVTWPASARIVLGVWDAPGGHVFQETLLTQMEGLQLRNHPSEPQSMNRAAILKDIDEFAIPNGYLDRHGSHLRADTRELTRLKFELKYITEVAWQCYVGDPPDLQLKPKSHNYQFV